MENGNIYIVYSSWYDIDSAEDLVEAINQGECTCFTNAKDAAEYAKEELNRGQIDDCLNVKIVPLSALTDGFKYQLALNKID